MLLPSLEEGLKVTARMTLQNGKRGISTGTGKVADIAFQYHGSYNAPPEQLTTTESSMPSQGSTKPCSARFIIEHFTKSEFSLTYVQLCY